MKVAFFHDVKILENDSQMYSVDFGYEVWERYLQQFDDLIVCTRRENSDVAFQNYKLSSGKNVAFKLNTEYNSPLDFFTKRKKINIPVKRVVTSADACIVRLPSIIGILAVKECIKQNKPWAVEVVGCCWDSLWNYGNIQGKLLAPIMYLLNRHYISKAKYVMYVSNEFLQKRYPTKGISYGVSDVCIEEFDEHVCEERINRIREYSRSQTFNIAMIGSLNVEYKGHRFAIKAIKELIQQGYNVKLSCLGGGNKEKWVTLAKDLGVEKNIEFCGTLPSGKPVLEWMDNIDLFIMPSLQEGLPRSMVEAMSRACNVIGAKTGGIPELIESDYIFKPKDVNALAKLASDFIEDKELREKQSIVNFVKAKEYQKEIIEQKRGLFYKTFKDSINIK